MSAIEQHIDGIGEGWRPLVRGLDTNLRQIDPNYEIHQVKEKFGGLRYYVTNSSDLSPTKRQAFDDLISEAESLSFRVCEHCGAPGKTEAVKYWVQTLCPLCRTKRKLTP